MPRFARPIPGGVCAHVVTRGNARATVFHAEADYAIFTTLLEHARSRVPIDLLAWCLMPNHVHLVVRPAADGDLARGMQRVRYQTTGRVWQGRYKAFPIQADRHLVTVLRYVERNPVRAGLADSAAEWPWSSARDRDTVDEGHALLSPSPVPLPSPWLDWVDTPLSGAELANIRLSVKRDRPLGDSAWTRGLAERLELLGTLIPRGRPRNL